MPAILMHSAGYVRIENVPDSRIKVRADALVRITASCICGSDFHPHYLMTAENGPARMVHELIGIVNEQALCIVRHGGVISRVGVPQYEDAPIGMGSLFRHNIRLAGGPAPVRAYIEELMPDILEGKIEPGKVFDATTDLDGVLAGYKDVDERKSLKVLIKP